MEAILVMVVIGIPLGLFLGYFNWKGQEKERLDKETERENARKAYEKTPEGMKEEAMHIASIAAYRKKQKEEELLLSKIGYTEDDFDEDQEPSEDELDQARIAREKQEAVDQMDMIYKGFGAFNTFGRRK